jgi:hypothetical protein
MHLFWVISQAARVFAKPLYQSHLLFLRQVLAQIQHNTGTGQDKFLLISLAASPVATLFDCYHSTIKTIRPINTPIFAITDSHLFS